MALGLESLQAFQSLSSGQERVGGESGEFR